MDVRTRMAPSPTGNLHIGTAYATMWSYLFARHTNGTFILRFEDTDQERSTKDFEESIENGLKWIGYDWDEGPFHQTERLDIYQQYAQKLLDQGQAYYCFCTKEELDEQRKKQIDQKQSQVYSGKCRNLTSAEVQKNLTEVKSAVIRYKLPDDRGTVEYEDILHGKVSFDPVLIGDTIIVRSNGLPLYNFAVVVDDIDMKISHVIRGDDHISNTPKQILLFEAFDSPIPVFAHYSMILNQDRIGKLSKRTGSTALDEFRKEGYLPEAMFNYIILLGWLPKDGREIFTKAEVIKEFEVKDMNASAAAWNQDKLEWMNGEYIRAMSDEELTKRLHEFLVDLPAYATHKALQAGHPNKDKISPVVPLIKERIKKLSDFVPLTDFLFEKPEYDKSIFEKLKAGDSQKTLDKILEVLQSLKKPWEKEAFEEKLQNLAKELGISNRDFFQLLRVAVSGQLVTPPLFESIQILGEEETLKRIEYVVKNYQNLPNLTERIASN